MNLRRAKTEDIAGMIAIRNSVTENKLSDPGLISSDDYKFLISWKGKGWICENEMKILGFGIIDYQESNVWALFVKPGFENSGIGSKLQHAMLLDYFETKKDPLTLSTEGGSRAESFYRKSGWIEIGKNKQGEIQFQLTYNMWIQHLNN
jgi:GNAT superfamily N-acetyltransferase